MKKDNLQWKNRNKANSYINRQLEIIKNNHRDIFTKFCNNQISKS